MQENPMLLTIPESAHSLRVSRSTIYRLISEGQIETIFVRGVRRVRPEALKRFIDSQQRNHREQVVNLR